MGSVYHARDVVLDRDVALKVLNTGPDLDPELRERFYREAKAGAKLQHPSIVVVYDLGESAGVAFIAMELLAGADLRAYITEVRPLSLVQKVEFLTQICDGLAHAHHAGIVHRDIKPSNIFIHQDRQAKVLDFGIARLASSKLTIVGKVLGTPNYMAPEQILSRPCDARSDLFSAAIVFFEFLVNKHPFQSAFIPRRIAEEAPDDLCEFDRGIPKSLDKLLKKALEKRPEDRVQTADEFAVQLRAIALELRTGLIAPTIAVDVGSQGANVLSVAINGAAISHDDSAQLRVSEFIRILREFDDALSEKHVDKAKGVMKQMRGLAEIDGRFTQAIQEYQQRLERMTSVIEPASPRAPAPPVSETAAVTAESRKSPGGASRPPIAEKWDATAGYGSEEPQPTAHMDAPSPNTYAGPVLGRNICQFCGGENRRGVAFCQNCGKDLGAATRLDAEQSVAKSVESARTPTRFDRLAADSREYLGRFWARRDNSVERTDIGPPSLGGRISVLTPSQKWTGGIIFTASLLILGAIATVAMLRPIPVERAVGRAVVRVPVTDILGSPTANGGRLMSLHQGTPVNLLDQLQSRDQRFVRVQFVSPRQNSRPGYVRTADLGGWDSNDSATAWSYIRVFEPGEGLSAAERQGYIDDLQTFVSHFPNSPQALAAELEMAKQYLSIARKGKNNGRPRSEWQEELDKAKASLAPLLGNPIYVNGAANLQRELDALNAPDPSSQAVQPNQHVEDLLGQIPALWYAANYDGILAVVKQIEVLDPNNQKAGWWKMKVIDARKEESELLK